MNLSALSKENALHSTLIRVFSLTLSIHLRNLIKSHHVHPSICAAVLPSGSKKQQPEDPSIYSMNPSRSCLPPVKKPHLRCTSACSGGRIRILTVVYLSWTSFACLIDPPVKWDHWLFPLIVGEVTALKSCFLSQHSLQSRSRTRAAKRFGLPDVQIEKELAHTKRWRYSSCVVFLFQERRQGVVSY